MEAVGGGFFGGNPESMMDGSNEMFTVGIIIFIIMTYVVVAGICVYVCAIIAKSKNISLGYMWLGLLTFIGVILIAVLPANDNNQYSGSFDNRNNNFFNNQNMYYKGIMCPYCGANVSQENTFCGKCGNKVR